jgi:signal transduction histidine kinase
MNRIKHLLIALVLLFTLIGVVLYFNMFHFACVVSFLLALAAGAFFMRFLVRQHKEALDSQEALRKRLTNDVAHELRTPLTAISSYLEMMIEGIWKPTPERLRSCYEEIERITGLVSDLERLAKVENENLRLEKADMDLLALAQTVAGNFESESVKKKLSLIVSGEEPHVNADKNRLAQVITNLLSNAIKYTPEGGSVRITVKDTPKNGVIIVKDTGIGIPKDELPLIFERFYRTDKSRSRRTGGAGIGLTIAKSVVEAHGGSVTVESGTEQGSEFTVEIPK